MTFDNYKNYRNLGEYDGISDDWEFELKDPKVYDDVKLKQMTCAHLPEDRQIFISRDGIEQERCRACGLWDWEDVKGVRE